MNINYLNILDLQIQGAAVPVLVLINPRGSSLPFMPESVAHTTREALSFLSQCAAQKDF